MAITEVANELTAAGCWEWQIHLFDGSRLCLIGGGDLTYAHVLELWVDDVQFLSCASRILHATFRAGSAADRAFVSRVVDVSSGYEVLVVSGETTASLDAIDFYIVGRDVRVVRGTCYHYDRPNLEPGERVSPRARGAM